MQALIETKRGLPNTCSRCGKKPGETWWATSDDAARCGQGICAECAWPPPEPSKQGPVKTEPSTEPPAGEEPSTVDDEPGDASTIQEARPPKGRQR